MKRISVILLFIFLLLPCSLSAESVFLKNGDIIEGMILKETGSSIEINMSDKNTRKIARSDVIRILYHGNYKNRKYLTKTDGTVIEVYIVDEDAKGYTYRISLNSPLEKYISKDDVDSISRKKVPPKEKRKESTITTVTVDSKKGWQNTGVFIIKGDRVKITSSGKWSILPTGNDNWSAPQGYKYNPFGGCAPLVVSANWAALVYKIGDGIPEAAGDQVSFTSEDNGELQLSINDCPGTFYDNRGSVESTITISR
jgi:hypothetical protein